MDDIIHSMDNMIPALLPVLRSQQQGEILALIFTGNGISPTQIAERTGVPYASVHREIERAERAGLVMSRRVGRTRLVSANPDSPYLPDLANVLVRAFGPPHVLAEALAPVEGIDRAIIHGSWAAHAAGEPSGGPVGDIDLLVLGSPARTELFAAASAAEARLGRPVQVIVREPTWWDEGSGAFHDNVIASPVVELSLRETDRDPTTR
jgi:DNA-binding transcriptional ArsR family regulator